MYDTDRGAEELARRRGEEEVSFEWLAERFAEFENAIDRVATWLARLDDHDED